MAVHCKEQKRRANLVLTLKVKIQREKVNTQWGWVGGNAGEEKGALSFLYPVAASNTTIKPKEGGTFRCTITYHSS